MGIVESFNSFRACNEWMHENDINYAIIYELLANENFQSRS